MIFIQIVFLLSTCLNTSSVAQMSNLSINKKIEFHCDASKCNDIDVMYLYAFNGIGFKELQKAKKDKEGRCSFKIPSETPTYYYIGNSKSNVKPILLGEEDDLTMTVNCDNMRSSTFTKKTLNYHYLGMMLDIRSINNKLKKTTKKYQQNFKDKEKLVAVLEEFKKIEDERKELIEDVDKIHPVLKKVALVYDHENYALNSQKFSGPLDYLSKGYFYNLNFDDPSYDGISALFEGARDYTTILTQIAGNNPEQHFEGLLHLVNRFPEGSKAKKFILGGAIASMEKSMHGNYKLAAQMYTELFGAEEPAAAKALQRKIDALTTLTPGGVAPDFTSTTPEGEALSLSDLKGKVVLLDFWASWCGPCRRENPNVVRMYNKYHEKGFEILGVSLDKTKNAWLKAIEKDGLLWHHVSDLKGWSNAVAAQYLVRSIPDAILLDREGKIIGRKLRGEALEAKLASIFGE